MIYLVTSVVLVNVFLLLKKYNEKQNIFRSLVRTIVLYECYLCLIAGVMTVFHIPVTVISISIINIFCIFFMLFYLHKKKNYQKYYVDYGDAVFIIVLIFIIIKIFMQRFSSDFNIWFATSDPGVHLKMAMNFVNNQAVDGMYIGQLINGLFIESLQSVFPEELVYKPFMIQCGINLLIAALIFWAVIKEKRKNIFMRLVVYIGTLVYVLGYPLNDFLYGFVYLQMTITIICFLVSLLQDFIYENVNIWIWGIAIGAACLGISIGYTLFAPPIYIGAFLVMAYKAHQEKWLVQPKKKAFISKRFILCALNTFLIPTFLTFWIVIIMPRLNGTVIEYGGALSSAEGAIYRNLYSDFLLFSIPAIYGILCGLKKKKVSSVSVLSIVYGFYYIAFLVLMLLKHISTYYFYKLNFLLWLFVLVAFIVGIEAIYAKMKSLCFIIISNIIILAMIFASGIEVKMQERNINYMPYTDSSAFFRIYSSNKEFFLMDTRISKGLVDVSGLVNKLNKDKSVIFVGGWQNLYWYEALTNQRFEESFVLYSYDELIEKFRMGEYGDYAVIEKNIDGIEKYKEYISENIINENNYAYLIKRK